MIRINPTLNSSININTPTHQLTNQFQFKLFVKMNKLIIACVLLTAVLAGAEPPQYRNTRFGQEQEQQQRGDTEPYAAAGAPSGSLLLLPGEYVVQPNSPYHQYGVPSIQAQVNAPQQQYTAPVQFGLLQYQPESGEVQIVQPRNQQSKSGQLRLAPGVQQPAFGQLQQQRFTVPQPNEKDAEQFNPQSYNPQQQYSDQEENDDDEAVQEKQKNQRGNVRFTNPRQEETDDDSVERYQQARYRQRGNDRYTASQQQNQENYNQYAGQNQNQPRFAPRNQGRYYQSNQQSNYNQPEIQDQYSQVNKYTPPRKYIPVAKPTEIPESASTTEYDETSTTEVATTTEDNRNNGVKGSSKENYKKDKKKESEDVENVNSAEGFYYLLLPDGKLQKIVYMTADDLKKMQFVARIQYQNIEPITGPIYSYNPMSSPFVKVF